MQISVETHGPEETERLAEKIGAKLKGGEVIELVSDLGGGKTTFVRGLARGAGSKDTVASPTFTVSKLYKTPKLDIHHLDFYRLVDAGLMEHEVRDLLGGESVLVVEWADVVAHVLPDNRLTLHLSNTGDSSRQLKLECPESLKYLVEKL